MAFDNERLEKLRKLVYSKESIKTKLNVIYKRKDELGKKLVELDKIRLKEQEDVDNLEKFSFASLISSLKGDKVERLEKEKDEAYAAYVKYEAALKEYNAINDNIEYYQNELEKIGNSKHEYEQLINEKFTYLKESGNPQAEEIMRLDELVGRMAKEIREIDEALIAGDKVKEAIEVVVADLEEAEYYAEMDLRSGKGVYDRAKYRRLNEAEGHIATLQIRMGSFRTELADVDIDTDINVDVGGICTEFADMFGNIFTEIKVLDKIRRLHNQAKNTRDKIISTIYRLEEKRDDLYNDIKDVRKQVEDLVIDTTL